MLSFIALYLLVSEPILAFQAHRFIYFNDHRPGEILTGKFLAFYSETSRPYCAKLCSLSSNCISYNYYMTRVCQLNSGDVFSKNAELLEDPASTYFGMKRDERPICVEKGREKDIRDDRTPNFCNINLKRQDAEWSDWVDEFAVDTIDEWKKVKRRYRNKVAVRITERALKRTNIKPISI